MQMPDIKFWQTILDTFWSLPSNAGGEYLDKAALQHLQGRESESNTQLRILVPEFVDRLQSCYALVVYPAHDLFNLAAFSELYFMLANLLDGCQWTLRCATALLLLQKVRPVAPFSLRTCHTDAHCMLRTTRKFVDRFAHWKCQKASVQASLACSGWTIRIKHVVGQRGRLAASRC